MNNRQIVKDQDMPVQEKYPNRFKPGQSGNPGGRPKRTAAELKAVQKMKKLTPEAVDVVVSILRNDKASLYARLQAAEIIFNRAMGRPETYLKVDNAEQSVEASVAHLQALFASDDDVSEGEPVAEENDPDDPEDESVPEEVTADAG